MSFKTIKVYKRKIISISALLLLAVYVGSKAKYKVTENIPLVNGNINYEISNFNTIAMYQSSDSGDYVEITRMPESGYAINEEKSYCKINGTKDNNAKLYTNTTGEHIIANLQKNSKCYIWFDKINNKINILSAGGQNKTSWASNELGVVYYEENNNKVYLKTSNNWEIDKDIVLKEDYYSGGAVWADIYFCSTDTCSTNQNSPGYLGKITYENSTYTITGNEKSYFYVIDSNVEF